MPRGGRRAPKPGGLYPNRTDLRQPVRTVPGQTYGMATEQAQAQKVVPLPTQAPVGQSAQPGGGASPPSSPGAGPIPGSLPTLSGPTLRPNEPVTAGAAMGAGPGMEALSAQPDNTADLLNHLAAQPGAPAAVQRLAAYVNSGRR